MNLISASSLVRSWFKIHVARAGQIHSRAWIPVINLTLKLRIYELFGFDVRAEESGCIKTLKNFKKP
jgi:hypothetical protein